MKITLSDLKFKVPSFQEELEEFNRYNFSQQELEQIKSQFKKENIQPLKANIWRVLKNTDSWDIKSLKDVKKYSHEYDKDWESIVRAVESKNILPAPIILERSGSYELIAGNTRLMVLRALNKIPQVLIIKL